MGPTCCCAVKANAELLIALCILRALPHSIKTFGIALRQAQLGIRLPWTNGGEAGEAIGNKRLMLAQDVAVVAFLYVVVNGGQALQRVRANAQAGVFVF